MNNIQGGFIYIDCANLTKDNSITIPGIFAALSRCNKIPVLTNIRTIAGAHCIGICNCGYKVGYDSIRLPTTITVATESGTQGVSMSILVSKDDIISM